MVTFRDIAGVDVACQELLEVVACLRDSDRYSALNAKVPSGVLLCGPPGTGKTLLGEDLPSAFSLPGSLCRLHMQPCLDCGLGSRSSCCSCLAEEPDTEGCRVGTGRAALGRGRDHLHPALADALSSLNGTSCSLHWSNASMHRGSGAQPPGSWTCRSCLSAVALRACCLQHVCLAQKLASPTNLAECTELLSISSLS